MNNPEKRLNIINDAQSSDGVDLCEITFEKLIDMRRNKDKIRYSDAESQSNSNDESKFFFFHFRISFVMSLFKILFPFSFPLNNCDKKGERDNKKLFNINNNSRNDLDESRNKNN